MQTVIVCTRNRPSDLARTLHSIAGQRVHDTLRTLVVDASDERDRARNQATITDFSSARHLPFPFAPSLPHQRNYGIDHLSDETDIVHFVDDDITAGDGYFCRLARALHDHPGAQGAGGVFTEPHNNSAASSSPVRRGALRFFLLTHPNPGRILPSGHAVPAQRAPARARRTQWLSGCSMSFRRSALEAHRFDASRAGYTTYDDVDLSYRVGRRGPLLVVREARLIHHRSPSNRYDARRFSRESLVSRHWFLEKNLDHPLRKAAFWWATAGRVAALLASRDARKHEALRGLWEGALAILQRTHPSLRGS